LAEEIIRDLGSRGTGLDDQSLPFTSALIAADAYVGEPVLPRLKAAAAALPADSPLGGTIARLADALRTSSARDHFGRWRPWNERGRPPGRADRDVLDRDWTALTGRELDRLWGAAQRSNDFPLAQRIFDDLGVGPSRWPYAVWFVLWLIHDDRIERATSVLRDARHTYIRRAGWSLLPIEPTTDVDLRSLLTDELRAAYLADVRDPFTEPDRA